MGLCSRARRDDGALGEPEPRLDLLGAQGLQSDQAVPGLGSKLEELLEDGCVDLQRADHDAMVPVDPLEGADGCPPCDGLGSDVLDDQVRERALHHRPQIDGQRGLVGSECLAKLRSAVGAGGVGGDHLGEEVVCQEGAESPVRRPGVAAEDEVLAVASLAPEGVVVGLQERGSSASLRPDDDRQAAVLRDASELGQEWIAADRGGRSEARCAVCGVCQLQLPSLAVTFEMVGAWPPESLDSTGTNTDDPRDSSLSWSKFLPNV